jgi:hypothetical protein
MASLSRLERLQLAAARLRQIQNEAATIYRSFPELDRRPKVSRGQRPLTTAGQQTRVAVWPAKLH